MGEITVQKITNVKYLTILAPHIQKFHNKVKVKGVEYESLVTYFMNTVQHGASNLVNGVARDLFEFWVVFEDRQPIAFAHMLLRGLPHIGKVYMDFIYSWTKNPEAVRALMEAFRKFGLDHRAVYYEGDAINKTVLRLFKKVAGEFNHYVEESDHINFIGWKLPEEKKEGDKTEPEEK